MNIRRSSNIKSYNYHYRNQSSSKINNSSNYNLNLPPINNRVNLNIRTSPIKNQKLLNMVTKAPQRININSFSDSRLPSEFIDLSYDNPTSK